MVGLVMIECSDTGEVVPTGPVFDRETFEAEYFQTSIFAPCLACGGVHTFATEDAWVEDDPGGQRRAGFARIQRLGESHTCRI